MSAVSVLTWNIQCGLGVDGVVDLGRIADVIRQMGGADVICLQEVARYFPELDGGQGLDQRDVLSAHFPGFAAFFGPALDRVGTAGQPRQQFGNMILSRLPVLQVFQHALPQPAPETPVQHMPRQALEVVVETAAGPLRVTTTHLEFHCARQRMAQVQHLLSIGRDVSDNAGYVEHAPECGPYAAIARPARSILCGDFNTEPGDDIYRCLVDGQHDVWALLNGQKGHAPTCGIHDHRQWPGGPHARDFFIVSPDLAHSVDRLDVDMETAASDHQPVRLALRAE